MKKDNSYCIVANKNVAIQYKNYVSDVVPKLKSEMRHKILLIFIVSLIHFSCKQEGRKISLKSPEKTITKDSIRKGKEIYKVNDTIKILEYKNINGKRYLNQSWIKNTGGDTIRGNYFLLKNISDTVNVNDFISLRFYLEGWLLSESSELYFILPKTNQQFKRDFSNKDKIETDTIKNLKYDSLNNHLKNLPLNHMVIANFKFMNPGETYIRGILKEVQTEKRDSIIRTERDIYFEKKFIVQDLD